MERKKIFFNGQIKVANNINPYLVEDENIVIQKRSSPILNLPQMNYGSKAVDGGNLIFSDEEKNQVIQNYPGIEIFIKRYIGSNELIKDIYRWCLWIEDKDLKKANNYAVIRNRIKEVYKVRKTSTKQATIQSTEKSHKFGKPRFYNTSCIIRKTKIYTVWFLRQRMCCF